MQKIDIEIIKKEQKIHTIYFNDYKYVIILHEYLNEKNHKCKKLYDYVKEYKNQ